MTLETPNSFFLGQRESLLGDDPLSLKDIVNQEGAPLDPLSTTLPPPATLAAAHLDATAAKPAATATLPPVATSAQPAATAVAPTADPTATVATAPPPAHHHRLGRRHHHHRSAMPASQQSDAALLNRAELDIIHHVDPQSSQAIQALIKTDKPLEAGDRKGWEQEVKAGGTTPGQNWGQTEYQRLQKTLKNSIAP